MLKIIFLVAVALAVTEGEGCVYKDQECAEYTVLSQQTDYEIRSYPAMTWVKTNVESRLHRVAVYKAFMRLFNYISGENDRSLKINMTVPVRIVTQKSGSQSSVTMSFMVPMHLADNYPIPDNKLVIVESEQPTQYAVRSFNGYVWRQNTWKKEAQALSHSLGDDETFIRSPYIQVGYDAPFDVFNRRNEVWMAKSSNEV